MKREFSSFEASAVAANTLQWPEFATLGGHRLRRVELDDSMLISVAPARSANACPSPMYSQELDHHPADAAIPPVAKHHRWRLGCR